MNFRVLFEKISRMKLTTYKNLPLPMKWIMLLWTIKYQLAFIATICRRPTAIKTVSALRSKVPTRHCFGVQKKLLIKLTKKMFADNFWMTYTCARSLQLMKAMKQNIIISYLDYCQVFNFSKIMPQSLN